MIKVFIDGREGTTGLRIAERFEERRDIELLRIPDAYRKDVTARKEYINNSDVTFLCLPDVAAVEAVALADSEVKIVDASTAHRTLEGWAYGFPELSEGHRKAVAVAKRVAVPGCHASGFLALVYPLVTAGLIDADYPVTCHSLTGYSGGGKSMIAEYESENRAQLLDSPAQYALGQTHKHLREMKHIAKLTHLPHFSPIVGDFYSGMEVTIPIFSRLGNQISLNGAFEFFSDYYKGQRFIKVLRAEGESLHAQRLYANKLSGRDGMEIYVGGNDDRVLLSAVFDNLGKGASGAAVQCFNIMCGADEATGLVI